MYALVLALFAGRVYLLIGKRRRIQSAVEKAIRTTPKESGTPFAELSGWQRVKKGGGITAVFPGGFSILLLLIWLYGGRYQRLKGTPTDVAELTILYFVGSVLLGATIGFGYPYMRGFVRSSLIATLAFVPLMIGCELAMNFGHWETTDIVVTASLSVLFGMALGHGAAKGQRRASEARNA